MDENENSGIDLGIATVGRIPVDSSNVMSIGFKPSITSPGNGTLEVEFKGNRIYMYTDVPISLYRELMAAPSKGAFINQNIAHNFNYRRIYD